MPIPPPRQFEEAMALFYPSRGAFSRCRISFLLRRSARLSRMELRRPDRFAASVPSSQFRQEIPWLSRGIKRRHGRIYKNNRVTPEAVCRRSPPFKAAARSSEPEPFSVFFHQRPERSATDQLDGWLHPGSEFEWTGTHRSSNHSW